MSSSSSQEGSRSSRSSRFRSVTHSHSPSSSRDSRSSGRHSYCSHAPSRSSHVSGGSSFTQVVTTLLGGVLGAHLTQDHPLSYHQSSASVASSYVRYAAGVRSPSVHVSFWLCLVRSSSPVVTALPVDDACSLVCDAVPVSRCDGSSACTPSCVAVDASVTCYSRRYPRCTLPPPPPTRSCNHVH